MDQLSKTQKEKSWSKHTCFSSSESPLTSVQSEKIPKCSNFEQINIGKDQNLLSKFIYFKFLIVYWKIFTLFTHQNQRNSETLTEASYVLLSLSLPVFLISLCLKIRTCIVFYMKAKYVYSHFSAYYWFRILIFGQRRQPLTYNSLAQKVWYVTNLNRRKKPWNSLSVQ